MGLFNLQGQFGGLFNNWRTNQYNQQFQDWQDMNSQQRQQYEQEMEYWNQMNNYDRENQTYQSISTGRSVLPPTVPRQKPSEPFWGSPPIRPQQMDFGAMFGGASGGWNPTPFGGGGGGGTVPGAFQGAGYQAPDAWNNPGIDTAQMVDPSAVIASAQPGIYENMNKAFADAGNRFGSSGMVGTPYASALGEASRGAANDIANITNQYQFQAAQSAAEREQQRQMAEYAANYNAWAQQGDWAHQGQMGDQDRALAAWGQLGDWQYGAGQGAEDRNLQQWMAQNNWGFQDYQNQQNQMMQFLPMLMQMMGGWG